MNTYLGFLLDLLAQFAGGRGEMENNLVRFGLAAMLWTLLLVTAWSRQRQNDLPREKLLVWGFGLGLGRELFMFSIVSLQILGVFAPESLHVIFPPLEHALAQAAVLVVAGAFLRYFLDDARLAHRYLQIGLGTTAFCYLATFWWWARYITAHPSSRFGQTWSDWLFRLTACVLIAIPIVLLAKKRGWLRNLVLVALTFFFLDQFLKLPDMAMNEVYGNIFAPIRHSLYIWAIPLLGYVYYRERVTERKQTEEEKEKLEAQLRHAQKMEAVGQLAGGVAHDFNNILTVILGNIELALMELKTDSAPIDYALRGLEEVRRSAIRAAALTRQLLIFSRRGVIQPEVLDLNRTLTEIKKMLGRLIPENITLEIVSARHIHRIFADAGQVEQVIMNLVVNAGDAMPDGGKLTLETANVVLNESSAAEYPAAKPGPYVMLAVRDTGCGMSAEIAERIFEPFFTTKPVGQGTGLGLATVYGIVKQAGGHITVDSAPGEGTTFKIYFPVVEGATEQNRVTPDDALVPGGNETILVCDDDAEVRRLAVHLLQTAGYTVLAAGNGAQALEQAAGYSDTIHLLVTDVIMPNMDGRKLSDALTAVRPGLKTLFISGYPSDIISRYGVLDEDVAFMTKPFSRRSLLLYVRKVLDGR